MTLEETYYAINKALIDYLASQSITCPLLKYGVDPAVAKESKKDNQNNKYPYLQSYYQNVKQQSWTSNKSGIYTTFDYQLSFFTAPQTEYTNDSKLFFPFEISKNAMSDIDLNLLHNIAVIKRTKIDHKSDMKSGQLVPAAFVVYEMGAVCSYKATIPDATQATNIDAAIKIN